MVNKYTMAGALQLILAFRGRASDPRLRRNSMLPYVFPSSPEAASRQRAPSATDEGPQPT